MFKRLLWLGVGVAVGVVVVRKLTRTAHAFTPAGIAGNLGQSAGGVLDSVRGFFDDVREGAAEREAEIADAIAHGLLITNDTEESEEY
ncbi:hypothetical protein AB0M43_22990 [Longispora sp. NPDC051575]|uniref:hypothetical protein n=1 Tax=Longispora sp. NPDC051575 TaxID=3154943 RepID=UPI003432BD92